ncbi:hypothetical protein GGS20DRAFT_543576 [Poronia punctata]|nr:hypothetical protein GGS20DRAFT_543576 [Poronia punctata]
MEIMVGCVDPEFLLDGGYGFALANIAGNNVWCRNEIGGGGVTTDYVVMRGRKWVGNSGG